jgi:hypothetical protein
LNFGEKISIKDDSHIPDSMKFSISLIQIKLPETVEFKTSFTPLSSSFLYSFRKVMYWLSTFIFLYTNFISIFNFQFAFLRLTISVLCICEIIKLRLRIY